VGICRVRGEHAVEDPRWDGPWVCVICIRFGCTLACIADTSMATLGQHDAISAGRALRKLRRVQIAR
jgi:hypothetical protein